MAKVPLTLENFWRDTVSDPVAFFTFALFVATCVLAIVAIVQIAFLIRADNTARIAANAASKAADVAERTLVAAQRPWVSLIPTLNGPLEFDSHQVSLNMEVLSRIAGGKAPALNVSTSAALLIPVDGESTRRIIKRCLEAFKTNAETGHIVFEDRDVREALTARLARSGLGGREIFQINVFVGLKYMSTVSENVHATGKLYCLTRNDKSVSEFRRDELVAKDSLALRALDVYAE